MFSKKPTTESDHSPMTEHTSAKTITFGIPCYNSAEYMDRCISSIIDGSQAAGDVHIVIVDDGSTQDNTLEKAYAWQKKYPSIVEAVHQENGGHGMAVLQALNHAKGTYFKVVDSDDWLDGDALAHMLITLRSFLVADTRVDLLISNYVYEHVKDKKQTIVDYHFALPKGRIIGWENVGRFSITQNLLMHALCYRTDVLRAGGIPMPAHTFYVDNIFAYVPLPRCKTLYYLDEDVYRYFIGRDDQSINEAVMVSRVDQQFRITRIMMKEYHLYEDVQEPHLRAYMMNYFTMMMAICSIFSRLSEDEDTLAECDRIWAELKQHDTRMYRRVRHSVLGFVANLPTRLGEKTTIGLYRLANKVVKFN